MKREYLRAFRLNKKEIIELRDLVKHYKANNYSEALRKAITEVLNNAT